MCVCIFVYIYICIYACLFLYRYMWPYILYIKMPCGPPRPLWAGPLWAPLGLCGPCPCGRMCARPWWAPWALVGRALVGPPWALMGWAIIGHSGRPIYKHMHIHMHMHVYVYIVYIYACIHVYIYTYIYIYIYLCTCIHICWSVLGPDHPFFAQGNWKCSWWFTWVLYLKLNNHLYASQRKARFRRKSCMSWKERWLKSSNQSTQNTQRQFGDTSLPCRVRNKHDRFGSHWAFYH